jgi:methionine-S-sulfoxide reductase
MKRLVFAGAAAFALVLVSAASTSSHAQTEAAKAPPEGLAVATFAAGCFWCTEADFDKVAGVVSTTSGYTGGHKANATYYEVGTGRTGHTEAVRIVYDPKRVSYERLLDVYWRNVDPLDARGQFCDKGSQYRPEIFVHDAEQNKLAEASKAKVAGKFKEPIVVKITPASTFYVAEDYHQDYYNKNPVRYKFYRYNCGRDARLEALWGKPATN